MRKILSVFVVATLFVLGVNSAQADKGAVDVGVFAGLHAFSETNELGVRDEPDADSQKAGFPFGVRVGYGIFDRWSIEGELALTLTSMRASGESSTVFLWRAHALYNLRPTYKKTLPFVVAGGGFMTTNESGPNTVSDTDFSFYGGVGFKHRLGDRLFLRGDARALFPPSSDGNFATVDFEALLGVSFSFGGSKKQPKPEPVADPDPDKDGILGAADQCPNEPENKYDYQDEDGCPDDPDSDNDGIADSKDKCPKKPETKNGFEDEDGCPDDPDSDGDGLVDSKDQCPKEPEDKDGFQDEDGCPDNDNDGDGIVDAKDKCPLKKEVFNGVQDEDGCPDKGKPVVVVRKNTVDVTRKIFFDTGKATIRPVSKRHLKILVSALKAHSTIRIRVEGHTDHVGSAARNMSLSQRRANAVVAFLVANGIAQGRLEAKGFGESVPLVPGKTAAAANKNRRVEFKIIGKN